MKNLHQESKLLNDDKFSELEELFEMVWTKDTTLPKSQEKWSESNKAYGQCAVTALVIQDLFGGKLVSNTDGSHFWNELPDGSQQDLSRKQFKDLRDFKEHKYVTRDQVLDGKGARLADTRKRYLRLKDLFMKISSSFRLSSV